MGLSVILKVSRSRNISARLLLTLPPYTRFYTYTVYFSLVTKIGYCHVNTHPSPPILLSVSTRPKLRYHGGVTVGSFHLSGSESLTRVNPVLVAGLMI